MGIKNIIELRDFVADQLESLCHGDLKYDKANACAMLAANMLLSVKMEMDYAKLNNEKPNIDFMNVKVMKQGILIEQIPDKKRIGKR